MELRSVELWALLPKRPGVEREGRDGFKELAHAVVKAEKSHHLLSASWRPRKAGGIIPVQV